MFIMLSYCVEICVFLIVLFDSGESLHPWQSVFKVDYPACNSEECFKHAKYLDGILNPNVDPCDDFYEYVCGKWEKKYPPPAYYPEWSVDILMSAQAYDRLIDILKQTPILYEAAALKRAKALFNACTNIPSMGLMDAQSLRHYIEDIHYFPLLMRKIDIVTAQKIPWLDVHNYYLSITGESPFFLVDIRADKKDNMKPVLYISSQISSFGLIYSSDVLTVTKLRRYKEFLVAVINHVMPSNAYKVSYTLIEKRLLDVLVFRRELEKIINENSSASNNCDPMTVPTFDNFYMSKAPISWLKIIEALYKNTVDPLSINGMKICIGPKKYFKALLQLLHKTPQVVIVNNIHLYFIERHLHLTPHLKNMLLKVVIQNGRIEEEIRYLRKRIYRCILSNELPEAMGKAYISKYFSSSTKEKGEKLVKHFKKMMNIQISDSTWLDNATKEKAKEKIDSMEMAVGYPEYYDDPLLREKYNHVVERFKPISTEAFYSALNNRLSISAVYFNPPLYHATFPLAVIYGGIGSSIGHEMYHAFSLDILQHKKLTTYWPRDMLLELINKTVCFAAQYHNKMMKELQHIPNAPRTNGLKTMDENVADSMGLNLAYWTFRKEVWKTKRCPILKDLPNITCDQLFFISYASKFCSAMTLDKMMETVQKNNHSPERIRVNEAVSNMEEFSKAFKCSKDAPMNPSEKCNIWN